MNSTMKFTQLAEVYPNITQRTPSIVQSGMTPQNMQGLCEQNTAN